MLKDRTLKKWAPFLMPEHKSLINKAYKESEKLLKPTLDEDELQEINNVLVGSIQDQKEIELTLWLDGFIEGLSPVIVSKIDPHSRKLYVTYKGNVQYFNFDSLVGASFV